MSVNNLIGDGAKVGSVFQAGNVYGSLDMRDGAFTITPAPGTEPVMPHVRELYEGLSLVAQAIEGGEVLAAADLRRLREACRQVLELTEAPS